MLSASDFLALPYTRDLTEGGISYALHSLHHAYPRVDASPYDYLRRLVARAAVELAFRRYLSARHIPFDVRGATPFSEPDRYDVLLGGRRCELKPSLIMQRAQVTQIHTEPETLLHAQALVESDQHAAAGYSAHDLYLFAFVCGLVPVSLEELHKAVQTGAGCSLVHVLPEDWRRPRTWSPLGELVLKSESEEPLTIEIGGQDEGRTARSYRLELLPRTRLEYSTELFSLSYMHTHSLPAGRLGVYAPQRRETHVVNTPDWGNIGVYDLDLWLVGFLSRDEFSRRAGFVQAGSRMFPYDHTQVKNLAVPVSELRPLGELFERARTWSAQKSR